MLVNLSSYGLGYPRPCGVGWPTKGEGMLIRGRLIEESLSQGGGGGSRYLLSRGGGAHSMGALIREGALLRGNAIFYAMKWFQWWIRKKWTAEFIYCEGSSAHDLYLISYSSSSNTRFLRFPWSTLVFSCEAWRRSHLQFLDQLL